MQFHKVVITNIDYFVIFTFEGGSVYHLISRSNKLLRSRNFGRRWFGLRLNDGSGIKLSVKLAGPDDLSLVGPTGVQLLDFCCSSVSELVCCWFISVMNIDLYVRCFE